jgi:L-ascorbate metabolism protein UlaG (beta-lactamase superfamily)
MKIIKYNHACVRLEQSGRALVIDPGEWTEPEALVGADAILVTHEHADHVDPALLAGLGIPVFAPAGADISGLAVTRIASGRRFEVAGFMVDAVGSRHAIIYGGKPDCPNLGFIVDDTVYHPGDSVHVPDRSVETLLVPAHGPWLKLAEAIDFVRAIAPVRAIPIHDAGLSERGIRGFNAWLEGTTETDQHYLPPGQSLTV